MYYSTDLDMTENGYLDLWFNEEFNIDFAEDK